MECVGVHSEVLTVADPVVLVRVLVRKLVFLVPVLILVFIFGISVVVNKMSSVDVTKEDGSVVDCGSSVVCTGAVV